MPAVLTATCSPVTAPPMQSNNLQHDTTCEVNVVGLLIPWAWEAACDAVGLLARTSDSLVFPLPLVCVCVCNTFESRSRTPFRMPAVPRLQDGNLESQNGAAIGSPGSSLTRACQIASKIESKELSASHNECAAMPPVSHCTTRNAGEESQHRGQDTCDRQIANGASHPQPQHRQSRTAAQLEVLTAVSTSLLVRQRSNAKTFNESGE
eukprot:987146-Amphidinium_carterae.1